MYILLGKKISQEKILQNLRNEFSQVFVEALSNKFAFAQKIIYIIYLSKKRMFLAKINELIKLRKMFQKFVKLSS